jgi:predicted PurR-regulated permease PerM
VARGLLAAAFFFAVFLLLLYQLFLFFAPFWTPIAWATILSLTFYPATPWLVWLCRGSRGLAAGLLVLVVTTGVVLPSVLIGSVLVRETGEAYEHVQDMARSGELEAMVMAVQDSRVGHAWRQLSERFGAQVRIDPAAIAVGATRWTSQQLAAQSGALARNVVATVVNFLLMLVALFFFFRDGERMAARIAALLPMEAGHKETIMARLYDTLTAVVQSMFLTAVAQGTLAGLGYWLIGGLRFSLFLGVLTGIASFVPMAGATLVWLSASIYLAATGEVMRGVLLGIWGAGVVSMVDNLIKPLFIGGRAKLPTFLLLFAMFGALVSYGFMGIFVAPVLLALLLSFVDIYRELYLPPLQASAEAGNHPVP